jgi:hypothetical protein
MKMIESILLFLIICMASLRLGYLIGYWLSLKL